MALTKKNVVLGFALLVTVGLVIMVDSEDTQDDLVVTKPRRENPPVQSQGHSSISSKPDVADEISLKWGLLAGREESDEVKGSGQDIFKSHSWYIPPPPKVSAPPPPPPKPVAPAVPYTYMGKMEDTPQGTVIMLSAGNKVYTVGVGETIDRTWRLDGDAPGSVRFTYVPLGLPQTLSKSAKQATVKPNETQGNP